MNNYYKLLLLFLLFIYSCAVFIDKKEGTTYSLSEIKNMSLVAQSDHKKLGLLVTIDNCIACDMIINNVDRFYSEDIKRKLELVHIKSNFVENQIFNQLLYMYTFPILIILDSNLNVAGIIGGANDGCQNNIKKVLMGKEVINVKNNLRLPDSAYISFVSDMFKAQYLYENKKYDDVVLLMNNINSKTATFYSHYLQAKAERRLGLDSLSKINAMKSLTFNNKLLNFLYSQQQNEMKYLAGSERYTTPPDSMSFAFETTTYDFGDIRMRELHQCTLQFKNVDSLPHSISDVSFSCNCVSANWDRIAISPNSESTISITYHPQRIGKFSNIVIVKSSDKYQIIPILIKGNVIK